jgi:hypothetical protein
VTWRDAMTMSAGGEMVVGRGKGGDDTSWTDINFTGLKKKFTRSIQLLQIDGEDLK